MNSTFIAHASLAHIDDLRRQATARRRVLETTARAPRLRRRRLTGRRSAPTRARALQPEL